MHESKNSYYKPVYAGSGTVTTERTEYPFGFILCVRNPPSPLADFIVQPDPVGLSEEKKILTFGYKEGIDDDGRALRRP